MMRVATASVVLGLAIAAFSLVACGDVANGRAGDAGAVDGGQTDGQGTVPASGDGGLTTSSSDGGLTPTSSDGGPEYDAGGDSSAVSGGYVDAGYYFGDGSFWVEGGAYPDAATLPDASSQGGMDAATDAETADASSGCGALAACCSSLQSASQALCSDVVAQGDATNCSTELALLQGAGDCTGVSVLASLIQTPPFRLVSDGTLLFWIETSNSPGLLAMPVGGGDITILVSGASNDIDLFFLAVDDVNVYVMENNELVRIPKAGGPATLVNESGAMVFAATTLGNSAYWVESAAGSNNVGLNAAVAVKSAPLLGGPVSLIAEFTYPGFPPNNIGVTSSTVFIGPQGSELGDFPMSTGVPTSGLTNITAGDGCGYLTSDTVSIYCAELSNSNLRIASDGTSTDLGPAVSSSYIAFDDTYAYWVQRTTVGTIMKAPKAGGGTATVLARDTSPTAIAVDAHSVYWGDEAGYIKSIPK